MKSKSIGRRARRIERIWFAALLALACDLPTEPETLLWNGELIATAAAEPLSGNVAMVANTSRTQIGVGITDALPDVTLHWRVRSGRCASAGTPVAPATTFPALVTSGSGAAEAEAVVNRRLRDDTPYTAELFADAAATDALACADLERTN